MILRLLHYFWERRVRSPNQSPNEGTPAAIWLPEWVHKSARLIAISCWSVIVSNGTSRPELAYRPTGPRSVGWPVGRLALLSQPTCDLCSHRGSFSKSSPQEQQPPRSQTQENRAPHPAFLQNRILPHARSGRSVSCFRILHRRRTGLRWPNQVWRCGR